MIKEFIKLSELHSLLNYSDYRSIESWCKKNRIPIIPAGKEKYVPSSYIEKYFNDKIVGANSTDSDYLSGTIYGSEIGNNEKQSPITHSKTTESFLNNINQ